MLCRWLQEPLATEVLGVVTMVNLRAPFAPLLSVLRVQVALLWLEGVR